MKFTPENITELQPNEVFVFGANESYIHGAGAARQARQWGAAYGKAGLQGQTYGIPTKNKKIQQLDLFSIGEYIYKFVAFAKQHQELTFLVTRIGTGLAGYTDKDIAPYFKEALKLSNVILPKEFHDIIYED